MNKHSLPKRIAIDTIGVLLIIAAGLTGWIPGPGGIPLLIAGLSLLSINHEWARRLLRYIKVHGVQLSHRLFNNGPPISIVVDLAGLILLIIAFYISYNYTRSAALAAAFVAALTGITLVLGNQRRLQRFVANVRSRSKRV